MFFRGPGQRRARNRKAAGSLETLAVSAKLHDGFTGAPFFGRFYQGPLWTHRHKKQELCQFHEFQHHDAISNNYRNH